MLGTLLRPKYWAGHIAMVLCVGFAVGLGLWQLDAWQTRRADAARDISNTTPTSLDSVMNADDSFPGRQLGTPVTLAGSWVGDETLYISDRKLDGVKGYWVVTPVRIDTDGGVLPVVRGWSATPDSATPGGTVAITGWLQATEGSTPIDDDPQDRVLTGMRLASMPQFIDGNLYSAYVVARDITGQGAPDGTTLKSVTASAVPPVSGFTALRNFLYAVEWWVFGAFALFVWVRWCRDTLEPEAAEGVPTGSTSEADA